MLISCYFKKDVVNKVYKQKKPQFAAFFIYSTQ